MSEIIEVTKLYIEQNTNKILPSETEEFEYNNKKIFESLYFGEYINKVIFNNFHPEYKKEIMKLFKITNKDLNNIKKLDKILLSNKNINKYNEENKILIQLNQEKFKYRIEQYKNGFIDGNEKDILKIIKDFIKSNKMNIDLYDIVFNSPWTKYPDLQYKQIHIKKVLKDIFFYDLYPNIKNEVFELLKVYEQFNNNNKYIYLDLNEYRDKHKDYFK